GVAVPLKTELLAASPAERKVAVTLGEPGPGQLGIVGGALVDRAFPAAPGADGAGPDVAKAALGALNAPNAAFAPSGRPASPGEGVVLARVADVRPGGPPGLTDALAAAAL